MNFKAGTQFDAKCTQKCVSTEFLGKCMIFAISFYSLIRAKCLPIEILNEDFYFANILYAFCTICLEM